MSDRKIRFLDWVIFLAGFVVAVPIFWALLGYAIAKKMFDDYQEG